MSTYTVSAREFANEIEPKLMYDPYSDQDPLDPKFLGNSAASVNIKKAIFFTQQIF
jgi:hypothetical protein